MKTKSYLLSLVASVAVLAICSSPVRAEESRNPSSSASCKLVTGYVGTIIGTGASKSEAFSQAVQTCFDRRVNLFERARGTVVSMDRGQDFIDSCVNLQCVR
ncbi:MAG: hypothetical protein KDD22_03425 [Bdellovibrionales bacterium]|nr:hypothetical protein [Bdellovibrionales bacterium]